MNELEIIEYGLILVPDMLAPEFIQDTLDYYFWLQEPNLMADIHSIALEMRGHLYEIASYHETAGEDITYFDKVMEKLSEDEQSQLSCDICEYWFEGAFEDVERILKFNRLTSVHDALDEPRENLKHYCVEVW